MEHIKIIIAVIC